MTTFVIIRDYATNDTYQFAYSEDEFRTLQEHWATDDADLNSLQHMSIFADRLKLSDLDPVHFNLLLCRWVEQSSHLSPADREKSLFDTADPRHQRLALILTGLIRVICETQLCSVDTLEIHIIDKTKIMISMSTSIVIENITSTPQFRLVDGDGN